MAEAVGLDPGTYAGTYKLIGGALALDFANLVSYRGTERQHDWLEPAGNARRWADAGGIAAPVVSDVAELQDCRESVARAFLAVADGATPAASDVAEIGDRAAHAWSRRRLTFPKRSAAARWSSTAPSLLDEVTLDAASLLTSSHALSRIAACGECRWLFLDTSRNRSRRWCDPADCGNRERQRRYSRRHPPTPS